MSWLLKLTLVWLCVFGGLCVDMWRLVHQWSFLLFHCFWQLVHCWYSLGRPVTTGTPMVKKKSKDSQNSKNDHWCTNRHRLPRLYQQCTNRHMSTKTVPTVYQQCTKNSQKTVKTAKVTTGVLIVTGLPRLYQQCTNCQKQSNSKKWPLVYQSSHVYTESAEYTKPVSAVVNKLTYVLFHMVGW